MRMISRYYYRFVKSRRAKIFLTVFLVGVLFLGFMLVRKRDTLRQNPRAYTIYSSLRQISDIMYLPYFFKKDEIPTFELEIDLAKIKEMDERIAKNSGHVVSDDKIFAPAKFRYAGKSYNVEVRYRGDEALHWEYPQKSYLIDFKNSDQFMGQTRINFILVDDRKFALEQFHNWRAGKLGLLHPDSGFANLIINGENHGLYFMIDGWSPQTLAKWGAPSNSNFYSVNVMDLPGYVEGVTSFGMWDNLYAWHHVVRDDRYGYEDFSDLEALIKLLHNSSDQFFFANIFKLVDKDNFYGWQIHQELMNSIHQNVDNTRLFFDALKGKFMFVPWNVSSNPPERDNSDIYGVVAGRIFRNPEFLHEKNKKLYGYVSKEENLTEDLAAYDHIYESMKVSLYKDRMKLVTNHYADKMYQQYRSEIIANFDRLRSRYENEGIILANFHVTNNDSMRFASEFVLGAVDIEVEGNPDFELQELTTELADKNVFKGFELRYDSNDNGELDSADSSQFQNVIIYTNRLKPDDIYSAMKKTLTRHRFFLVSQQISSTQFASKFRDFKILLNSGITGEKIKDTKVSKRIINEEAFRSQ